MYAKAFDNNMENSCNMCYPSLYKYLEEDDQIFIFGNCQFSISFPLIKFVKNDFCCKLRVRLCSFPNYLIRNCLRKL